MTLEDPSSHATPGAVRVVHLDWELVVDFDEKVVHGYATYTATIETAGATTLTLDTSTLHVSAVEVLSEETGAVEQPVMMGAVHPTLGSALTVTLPSGLPLGACVMVGVRYTTDTTCSALQFLDPKMTAEKTHPYLFSQCQAIHARSLVPCQDMPAVKMSYSATVWVPEELTALMSAVPVDDGQDQHASKRMRLRADTAGLRAFHFVQAVPIPSYLLALAVGKLVAQDIGPRSRVWSEASMVAAGAYEFGETEAYLAAGEAVAGEYVWGRYDILLLPPSFPYGGMENPCLTFVTPTLIAGDRSQANVVAHEIAHSWCGNLVTNRTWEHFWMNEGFTVFLERKILGRLSGEPTLQFHALKGLQALEDTVRELGAEHNFTRLVPDLSEGTDPDDAFSRVPYEKGFNFLYFLQSTVGGASVFEPFFKHFIQKHASCAVDSNQFKEDFLEFFAGNANIHQIDWEAWLYSPGMPPVGNQFDATLMTEAAALADKWHFGDVMGLGTTSFHERGAADLDGWAGEKVAAFLQRLSTLRAMQPLHANTARQLEAAYGLNQSKNAEIRFGWYQLALAAELSEVVPEVIDFVTSQGRMKYVRPMYKGLFRSKMGKTAAVDTFLAHRASLHPIAQKMVGSDLGLK